MLETDAYQQSLSPLTIALGKTATGEPYVKDLMTMPHLLIAGAKDAGKATGLIALLTSILHRASPDDVRLILVDTADAGLSVLEGIPHLQAPVIAEPRQAAITFRWAVREMERRYQILATAGVRKSNAVQQVVRAGAAASHRRCRQRTCRADDGRARGRRRGDRAPDRCHARSAFTWSLPPNIFRWG